MSALDHPLVVRVKQGPVWDGGEAAAGLYAGHEIKEELVLGPEQLQPQDIAFSLIRSENLSESCTVKQEPAERPGARGASEHEETLLFNVTSEEAALPVGHVYSCDSCGEHFKLKVCLDSHIKVHTRDKPYTCDICQKTYCYRPRLDKHKLIHTGINPHTCDICQNTFRLRSFLDKHKLVHTRYKPHTCNMCHKRFEKEGDLKNHKRFHKRDKCHTCDVCQKTFRKHSFFMRHKLDHIVKCSE